MRAYLVVALFVIAVATALLTLGCDPFGGSSSEHPTCSEFEFDARAWASGGYAEGTPPTPRQRMADGFVQCQTLHGRGRQALRRLLGRPDNHVTHGLGASAWSWALGPQRQGYPIDDEHLIVHFDKRDSVAWAEIGFD